MSTSTVLPFFHPQSTQDDTNHGRDPITKILIVDEWKPWPPGYPSSYFIITTRSLKEAVAIHRRWPENSEDLVPKGRTVLCRIRLKGPEIDDLFGFFAEKLGYVVAGEPRPVLPETESTSRTRRFYWQPRREARRYGISLNRYVSHRRPPGPLWRAQDDTILHGIYARHRLRYPRFIPKILIIDAWVGPNDTEPTVWAFYCQSKLDLTVLQVIYPEAPDPAWVPIFWKPPTAFTRLIQVQYMTNGEYGRLSTFLSSVLGYKTPFGGVDLPPKKMELGFRQARRLVLIGYDRHDGMEEIYGPNWKTESEDQRSHQRLYGLTKKIREDKEQQRILKECIMQCARLVKLSSGRG